MCDCSSHGGLFSEHPFVLPLLFPPLPCCSLFLVLVGSLSITPPQVLFPSKLSSFLHWVLSSSFPCLENPVINEQVFGGVLRCVVIEVLDVLVALLDGLENLVCCCGVLLLLSWTVLCFAGFGFFVFEFELFDIGNSEFQGVKFAGL